jgi:hypothetical protein
VPALFEQIDFYSPLTQDSPSALSRTAPHRPIEDELRAFQQYGTKTLEQPLLGPGHIKVPVFVNEFWTARQRQAHSLHEVSYRACFKPQLPRFFIERFTQPGEIVYDPFMGRGTTLIEAALLGRNVAGNDVNPLSQMLVRPRLNPPALAEIAGRLKIIDFTSDSELPPELFVFYHPDTLRELLALQAYFHRRTSKGQFDHVDDWIRMVALNRLTGHSKGFFSVYTLPPNQAVSIKAQQKINCDRNQVPPRRVVPDLILKKSRQLLKDLDLGSAEHLERARNAQLLTGSAAETPMLQSESVALVVTSPPFLDIVDYATDNWLRCWFAGIDAKQVQLTVPKKIEQWQEAMTAVFVELARVLVTGGHVAFEVGEVRKGTIRLEETVLLCGVAAGLKPRFVLINEQEFTKTANCWGVDNNSKGTNSNRIVVFQKVAR